MWSEEEDEVIIEEFKRFGTKFTLNSTLLPHRSVTSIKMRLARLREGLGDLSKDERAIICKRDKIKVPWSAKEIDRLIAVCRAKGSRPSVVAKQFPDKSQASIRY